MGKRFFLFLKRPRIAILAIVVVLLGVGGYFLFWKDGEPAREIAAAKRMDIRQEVSVTGRVEPIESVDLSFEKSGRVRRVAVAVGERVSPGMILMSLENSDLYANRAEAEADLKVQQAILDEYRRGTRPEEILISEAKVKSAKSSVIDAASNLIDKINDSYTKSDDSVRNKVDQFFLNPRGSNPQLLFSSSDSKLETTVEQERFFLESELVAWGSSLAAVEADIQRALINAKDRASGVRTFLDNAALLLSILTPSGTMTQTTIDGYRADVSTARTNINTALTNLTSAEEKLRSAEDALVVAERELDLLRAGKTAEDIAAQEARVSQAEARVRSAEAEIEKTIIRAPITGIVTEENVDPGEAVTANVVMVRILSASGFKVESFIPEVDIAKVSAGDGATITLDAYGSDILFSARVGLIDPRETIIDGVATYKITFDFVQKDERIRAGMTANIDILTEEKKDVLAIPQRAVKAKNGGKYVDVLESDGKTVTAVQVEAGLKGSDGNIEIISGITEGQSVVVFSK